MRGPKQIPRKDRNSTNVQLPDSLQAVAEHLTARCGFSDASEYLTDLVRKEWERSQRQDPDCFLREALAADGDPDSVSQEALARRKVEVEGLLEEGLVSGSAGPLTPPDWQALGTRVARRLDKSLD